MNNKLAIVKGCAGLGNRLITICSAIEYCNQTNRKYSVDWSDGLYGQSGDNVFIKYFSVEGDNYIPVENAHHYNNMGVSVFPDAFKNNLHLALYALYQDVQIGSRFYNRIPGNKISFLKFNMFKRCWALNSDVSGNERENIFKYFNTLSKKSSFPFGNYLQNNIMEDIVVFADYNPFFIEKNLSRISLKPIIGNIVNEFSEKHQLRESIGVHVRYTDIKPTKTIQVLIDAIKKTGDKKKIFLSTDAPDVLNIFRKYFETVIVYEKYSPELENNLGLHEWAQFNSSEKAELIFKDSIIDLYLLGKCGYLFYQGNSTFSTVAKALHPDKQKCIDWLN